jgi:hypothetical protein
MLVAPTVMCARIRISPHCAPATPYHPTSPYCAYLWPPSARPLAKVPRACTASDGTSRARVTAVFYAASNAMSVRCGAMYATTAVCAWSARKSPYARISGRHWRDRSQRCHNMSNCTSSARGRGYMRPVRVSPAVIGTTDRKGTYRACLPAPAARVVVAMRPRARLQRIIQPTAFHTKQMGFTTLRMATSADARKVMFYYVVRSIVV